MLEETGNVNKGQLTFKNLLEIQSDSPLHSLAQSRSNHSSEKYDLLKKLTKRGNIESRSYWVESAIAKGIVDSTDPTEGGGIRFV